MALHIAKGPASDQVSKADAEKKLREDPRFPKDASVELEVAEDRGRWIAVWHEADWKQSDFPGAPADSEEDSPGPKSEGPDDTAPSPDKDEGGDSKPKSDGGDKPPKKDGGDGGTDHKILSLLEAVVEALGIPVPGAEEGNPLPGEDEAPMPPPPGPPGGPPGHGGPPPGPPGAGGPPGRGGPKQVIQHEKALKPGEAPPGSVPVGAPSFASVAPKGHPWADVRKASFEVAEPIPENMSLASVEEELRRVAHPTIFEVKQFAEDRDDKGHRIARALLSADPD